MQFTEAAAVVQWLSALFVIQDVRDLSTGLNTLMSYTICIHMYWLSRVTSFHVRLKYIK